MSRPRTPFRIRRRLLRGAVAAFTGGALALVLAPPAAAEPATSIAYPSGGTSTRYSGLAFDTCTAPSLAAMKAWGASPYRAVGIYFGGVNRTCAQPQLTASWVTEVSKLRWRLLPIYKGLQPPCGARPQDQKITPAGATAEGKAAATDAIAKAKALGLLPGSAFYNDIEHYSRTDATCRTAVLKYLSAWTKELHARGYLSGVYMNLNLGAKDLADVYDSTAYARPDALWIARYDGSSSLKGWAGIADSKWAVHQRAKQYTNSHNETYGGVTINIDNDRLDAPVATVAHTYKVTSSSGLSARSGPSTSSPVVRTLAPGSSVKVVCQAPGSKVGTTSVWDKLSDGTYASDYYVSTPSNTGYSAPLPRCTYPYQVTAPGGVNQRTGPGTSYATAGTLPGGALAWVVCQAPGSTVSGTKVWNKLDTGRWVSDYYVANASNTTYSKPVPRC
ncbi:glycoside hydrolase domain-containing protein [Streptomyces sp. KR80]|uniref:glycoside hydrolase domain-containing protein n=1 Tax=Streptomyces sp. KR80 TaxID=3457426 RepID=UPI003FCF97F6